ncbi:MAG: hypothetical protein H6Q74_1451 [Firmicutes bacterium]|nr:hypothetical protein [Bacillota bacterium]
MNQLWLTILAVLFGGSIVKYGVFKYVIFSPVVTVIMVIIDLLVLGVCYLVLRRYPYINVKESMKFVGAVMALEIMCDIGIITGFIRDVAFFALIAWAVFKQNRVSSRPPRQRHKWHK